ncbi:hypothetical protein ALI144C_37310 [Actinosynnema sp. ALI-1.44]|uniref:hypothetical protein n=1 Tax=Actinosynnema sp. ALI-1.44 TaxID=1933779 RepID=UPI00097C32B1|nr:hypothetical protein [Actinosynnema sp. ALI-1.44]ONI76318.1 hypothetical protein ALI144C_37310 [Actinosynnema sp. ALI-1.44]
MTIEQHRDALRRGKQAIHQQFGGDPNVTGVGIGFRWRGGELTDEPAVIALVAKKRPEGHVARRRLLPRSVDVGGREYGVDVVEAGPFFTDPPAAESLGPITDKFRPLRQGSQIGNATDRGVGTLGCMVRDRTDDTLCVLTNNHVIARLNQGKPGEKIFQPVPSEVIGTLKRYVPMLDMPLMNQVDAAIASVTDESLVSKAIVGDLMPPVSTRHPAVGMVVGGDTMGTTVMTPIAPTLDRLGVDLIPANSVGRVTVGMNIDKVGRTTRYTSSRVVAVDVVADVVYHDGVGRTFDNFFVANLFALPGDSGSVVCAGGDGRTLISRIVLACYVLTAVGGMYALPLAADNPFVDRLRDEFFALTAVGRLISSIVYINSDMVLSRSEGVVATDTERSEANRLYTKYRQFVENALNDPDRPDLVVTKEHLEDMALANYGLKLRMRTQAETTAADALFNELAKPTLGMNHRQILDYMNDPKVFQRVYDIFRSVPSLEMHGPITGS